ncbi:ATP-binding protein [Acidisoma silvae]|uniref:histidine kinase n=1 Tax=Acidisoma silvae TaxID=2802396 RepID=A0A963YQL4_9PROT|nr:ATP-binding protein [Acidisoma silvae]MCB8874703.1 HAMP domain-containing protein [Acidisoma silvae]
MSASGRATPEAQSAAPRRLRIRLWPGSLAARTALVLIVGLVVVQTLGLGIHTLDRNDLVRVAGLRVYSFRIMSIYRDLVEVPAAQQDARLKIIPVPKNFSARLADTVDAQFNNLLPTPPPIRHAILFNMDGFPIPPELRPQRVQFGFDPETRHEYTALELPNNRWLVISSRVPRPDSFQGIEFLIAFIVMTALAAAMTIWAVRRLTAPVRTLAAAAEALGRDVNAPPLPEDGPSETAAAAKAFNTMAGRIRRFVEDRTLLLTAIGHDLRTPITRMRLRAEFMEDDEQRGKMLSDLDEMEAMVSATIAFGRIASPNEPVSPIDLAELLRTVLDEAGDAAPDIADQLRYEGPSHLTARLRPQAFKRALTNIIGNAVKYGGSAHAKLTPPARDARQIKIEVLDVGPGIPPEHMERVMQPFQRLETSRNRETGGVGLGLPIARDITRAHGGDLTLANRPEGGARITITLPI